MIMSLQQTERTPEFLQFPLCPDKWVELLTQGVCKEKELLLSDATETYLVRPSPENKISVLTVPSF